MRPVWHEDEEFWAETAPFQFSQRAWATAEEQVEAVVKLLGLSPGMRVLDMPCGPGRHSLALARRGFSVTGVDRTPLFIEEARRRAEEESLEVELIREDMRRFRRPEAFDAALNLFTSFGYFDNPAEDRRVLENFFTSLKPNGKILVDIRGKETLARDFRTRDWVERQGALLLEEREIIEGWSRVRTRWVVIREGKWKEFTLTLRLYSGAELKGLLEEVGFQGVRLYGDFAGGSYGPDARRLFAVAVKPS